MNLNKAFLIGRVTREPESRVLPSGQEVVSFGLATDRYYQDKNGQKQQKTEFHNIIAFGRLAEIAKQYLGKGSLVMIEGRIQTRNWQDNVGNKKSRTEIVAERMQLGPKSVGKILSAEEKIFPEEEIPVIDENEEEIDVKNIPF